MARVQRYGPLTPEDFKPDPDHWCQVCLGEPSYEGQEVTHDNCLGETKNSEKLTWGSRPKCECPCNGKLTPEERFALRKLLVIDWPAVKSALG
jgi:hypothetical protein